MSMQDFHFDIMGYALLAGLLVSVSHVPFGLVVLNRGIIFIDLAIAQVAGFGVLLAHSLEIYNLVLIQVIAVGSALFIALVLNWTDRKWPDLQEAIIGIVFILAASAGLLIVEHIPTSAEKIKNLLSGQIVFVEPYELITAAVVYSGIFIIWVKFRNFSKVHFYLAFAITITISVQMVGIYLVFATLIIPALVARQYTRYPLLIGYFICIVAYVAGLVITQWYNIATGPVLVWSLALSALLVMIFGQLFKSEKVIVKYKQ